MGNTRKRTAVIVVILAAIVALYLWSSRPVSQPQAILCGSRQSNKYHYPSCSAAQRIHPENLVWFSSPEEARSRGYVPCKICRPPLTSR